MALQDPRTLQNVIDGLVDGLTQTLGRPALFEVWSRAIPKVLNGDEDPWAPIAQAARDVGAHFGNELLSEVCWGLLPRFGLPRLRHTLSSMAQPQVVGDGAGPWAEAGVFFDPGPALTTQDNGQARSAYGLPIMLQFRWPLTH